MKTTFENFFENFDYLLNSVEEIKKRLDNKKNLEPPPKNISINQAIIFLKERGLIISKSKIYKLTSSNSIPYKTFGNRLVFDTAELEAWAQSKIITNENNEMLIISKSATIKIKQQKHHEYNY